jgi:hypothetical protein
MVISGEAEPHLCDLFLFANSTAGLESLLNLFYRTQQNNEKHRVIAASGSF